LSGKNVNDFESFYYNNTPSEIPYAIQARLPEQNSLDQPVTSKSQHIEKNENLTRENIFAFSANENWSHGG